MTKDPDCNVEEYDQVEEEDEVNENHRGQNRKISLKDILCPKSRKCCVAERSKQFLDWTDQEGFKLTLDTYSI